MQVDDKRSLLLQDGHESHICPKGICAGSTVGVRLDMDLGTVHFYLDGRPRKSFIQVSFCWIYVYIFICYCNKYYFTLLYFLFLINLNKILIIIIMWSNKLKFELMRYNHVWQCSIINVNLENEIYINSLPVSIYSFLPMLQVCTQLQVWIETFN